jgi:hypothetical protein
MTARAVKTGLKDIEALRGLFLQESNHQIRYNACHEQDEDRELRIDREVLR